MRKNGHLTAFYLETLLLIAAFLAMILILTRVFGLARRESAEARALTDAVTLAQNAAEVFSAAETPEDFRTRMEGSGVFTALPREEASEQSEDGDGSETGGVKLPVFGTVDGGYTLALTWREDPAETGLVRAEIAVFTKADPIAPVYELRTASFKGEAAT